MRGIIAQVEAEPAGAFTCVYGGVYGSVRLDVTQLQISGRATGVEGYVSIANTVTGTFDTADGGRFWTNAEDGTIETAKGLVAITPYVDNGSVTTGYGIHVDQGTVGAGSITTLYGIYIDAITEGGTNYAIYTNAGLIRIGDIINYAGAMGDSAKDPTTDAPDDWVEC